MAITQAVCNSFKQELLQGLHDLDGHTLKLALYTSSATLGPTTTAFSTTNESSGTNYTSGGATISNVAVSLSGTVAFVDFDDVSFSSATISDAAGALIYNSSCYRCVGLWQHKVCIWRHANRIFTIGICNNSFDKD